MDSNAGMGYTEFDTRRTIAGDIETVRRRLCDVLEEFKYRVLSEQPIQARRPQQRNIFAANHLEVNVKLSVALKPLSPHATLATFAYAAEYIFTEGDKQTFECEVDAVVALATASAKATVCRACGAGNTGDSRFCRSCGAPAARESLPAELEVMRLTAGARAAHQEHFTGLLIILINLAIALPLILLSGKPKAVRVGLIVLAVGQILGWLSLLYGMLRLHRTLNPRRGASREPFAADFPRSVAGAQGTSALPPASANTWAASVTEGTTELLGAPPKKEPAAEPARRARENTDPL
jgi:ribosomal protein L40E